ncbi:hypothetical protein, variant [Verruconis gallopava]|uniref:Mitochondrial thiamine pyrophosphate carrier 1 n=1 Tax=Verruconis gallopava TaxID=253628 RepID=A0A0D2B645_9PEZI|nr:hypothetical protein, variant [Verruconis gallopava]KIW06714.1 hypothetical protein, variant [Verruconis gallopava]
MLNGETANQFDARVESLWRKLDAAERGYLDLHGLKKGLKKMDHPLKYADSLLQDIFNTIDTNRDGRISYFEFHTFVRQTENELWELFKNIDRNKDGHLDKDELASAFSNSGVAVSKARLDRFFAEVDSNNDGSLSFEEWRDFLLFIPSTEPGLKEVISYFSASLKVNPEGDVLISDDLVQGLGYFVAGGISGIVSRTTTAPLDRLKVYLIAQTKNAEQTLNAAKSGAPLAALRGAWRTSANAMKDLWAAGGMRSLFAGNGINIVKVMPESAIKFGTFEAIKRVYGRLGVDKSSSSAQFVGGGVAGMVSQFAVYPLDTLKFRMQCETVANGLHGNALIIQTAQKMWRSNGIVAFYRGLPMGLIGIFPYAAIDMGTFEYLKRQIAVRNARKRGCHEDDAQPSSFTTACVGGFSGALGASVVYPLNLLRTRLQSQGTVLHPRTYSGIRDVFQQTIQGEGVRGLFKGLTPNLLKVVPAVSITWVVYENCKKQMNLH